MKTRMNSVRQMENLLSYNYYATIVIDVEKDSTKCIECMFKKL